MKFKIILYIFYIKYFSHESEGELLHSAHHQQLHGTLRAHHHSHRDQVKIKNIKKNNKYIKCVHRFPGGPGSPGPQETVYTGQGDTGGYVTTASPQPNSFPAIPINRVSHFIIIITFIIIIIIIIDNIRMSGRSLNPFAS